MASYPIFDITRSSLIVTSFAVGPHQRSSLSLRVVIHPPLTLVARSDNNSGVIQKGVNKPCPFEDLITIPYTLYQHAIAPRHPDEKRANYLGITQWVPIDNLTMSLTDSE